MQNVGCGLHQCWLETLQVQAAENSSSVEEQSNSDESPINHYRLLADVRDTVDHDAIVTEDGARLKLPVTQLCPSLRLLSVRAGGR